MLEERKLVIGNEEDKVVDIEEDGEGDDVVVVVDDKLTGG